ncbi:hypothetical protein KIH74_03980 [Kineosporia sp. J2-2]|uniref:Zinc-ribbon domain-containing protein n=1 Tax=Kineosporia corallincola TaxID=2835133 RepID=A0ABS5TAK0_9ACTN|nr:hypothetical protein [Kineosporia corallincola]MBT0768066.1 hypothetical protein [Kineosporia corallincola]
MTSTLTPTLGGAQHAEGQLYVTATHKVRATVGRPPFDWVPYGVQHAWKAGARKTLCGEWTSGWTVFWDRSFSATAHQTCPACVEASLPEASRSRLDPALRRTA